MEEVVVTAGADMAEVVTHMVPEVVVAVMGTDKVVLKDTASLQVVLRGMDSRDLVDTVLEADQVAVQEDMVNLVTVSSDLLVATAAALLLLEGDMVLTQALAPPKLVVVTAVAAVLALALEQVVTAGMVPLVEVEVALRRVERREAISLINRDVILLTL